MQHELLILRSLLVASMLVCGLIVGNMLTYTGAPIQLAAVGQATIAPAITCDAAIAHATCASPAA